MAEGTQRVEITIRAMTLVKVAAIVGAVAAAYVLRDVVALVVVAVVLAILVSPVADTCERHRLPRAFGILAVYAIAIGLLGLLTALLAQPLIAEVQGLAGSFPAAWTRVIGAAETFRAFSIEHGLVDQLRQFAAGLEGKVARGVLGALAGAFGGALSFLLVLVLTFYFATYATVVRRTLIAMAPATWQPFLIGVVPRIERKMGAWLRGLLTLAVIIAIIVTVGLSILRVEYALLLGLIAGVMEVVPYVGPLTAAIVAVLLAFLQSPVKAFLVLVFFIVVQQLENHLLVPKVMQRAVGIHPVVSLLAILIGGKVGGIPGALLAIPIVAGAIVFAEEYARERQRRAQV